MDRDILLKAFDAGSMPLTLEEIEAIMDAEMAKDPSEMDGNLVEACLEILAKASAKSEAKAAENNGTDNKETVKNKKKIRLRRIFLFAAIIIVLLGVAVPVGAKYIRSDVSEKIVKFYTDHFEIDLTAENNKAYNYSDDSVDIVKTLNEKGIENVILPSELLKDEYVKTISGFAEDEQLVSIRISFNYGNDVKGEIGVSKHKTNNTDFLIGQSNAHGKYDSVKQLTINGMDILIFSNDKRSYIIYVDGNSEYSISIDNCDFAMAIEIAKTIE